MTFRVGALALRAAETPQTIPMLPEALAMDVASSAGHRHFGFFSAHHGFNNTASARCLSRRNCGNGWKMAPFWGLAASWSSNWIRHLRFLQSHAIIGGG